MLQVNTNTTLKPTDTLSDPSQSLAVPPPPSLFKVPHKCCYLLFVFGNFLQEYFEILYQCGTWKQGVSDTVK